VLDFTFTLPSVLKLVSKLVFLGKPVPTYYATVHTEWCETFGPRNFRSMQLSFPQSM